METEILTMLKNYLGDDYDESQEGTLLVLIQANLDEFIAYMCYPEGFNEEKINSDLRKNKSCIFRCVLYDYNMQGTENQQTHSESGTNRSWEEKSLIYARCGIVPYAQV